MKPEKVAIPPAVLKKLRRLVKSVWFTETGGPMVGYLTPDSTLVVTDVAGPGPKSIRKAYSVTIDGEFSQQFCDETYIATGGKSDYIGDWHCHPSLSLQPSMDDESAMRLMANTEGLTNSPVSLIYSRISHRKKAYRWDGDLQQLVSIPLLKPKAISRPSSNLH
jgi:integrative and conjugative element protein (TIGR02256 family)